MGSQLAAGSASGAAEGLASALELKTKAEPSRWAAPGGSGRGAVAAAEPLRALFPASPPYPPTCIRYCVLGFAENCTCEVVSPESSLHATCDSVETLVPTYTDNTVSKSEPAVLTVTVP